MNKEDFLARYASPSTMSKAEFDECYVILECRCGSPICDGWAVVRNSPEAIGAHEQANARRPILED